MKLKIKWTGVASGNRTISGTKTVSFKLGNEHSALMAALGEEESSIKRKFGHGARIYSWNSETKN